ncbi:MAG: YkgJ family cysteine cluster protein [Fibrobacterota bacterium]
MKKWWEKNQLSFDCVKGCVKCCKRDGLVYFSREDIKRASDFLRVSGAEFKRKYLCFWGSTHVVVINSGNKCPFLTVEGCSIHEAKPEQCLSYPFWPEIADDINSWNEEKKFCPGIGRGIPVKTELIAEYLRRQRRNPV